MKVAIMTAQNIFSPMAYGLTLFSGLSTIMGERYLFRRRKYYRDAKVTAVIGWTYLIGGTLLYVVISLLGRML